MAHVIAISAAMIFHDGIRRDLPRAAKKSPRDVGAELSTDCSAWQQFVQAGGGVGNYQHCAMAIETCSVRLYALMLFPYLRFTYMQALMPVTVYWYNRSRGAIDDSVQRRSCAPRPLLDY